MNTLLIPPHTNNEYEWWYFNISIYCNIHCHDISCHKLVIHTALLPSEQILISSLVSKYSLLLAISFQRKDLACSLKCWHLACLCEDCSCFSFGMQFINFLVIALWPPILLVCISWSITITSWLLRCDEDRSLYWYVKCDICTCTHSCSSSRLRRLLPSRFPCGVTCYPVLRLPILLCVSPGRALWCQLLWCKLTSFPSWMESLYPVQERFTLRLSYSSVPCTKKLGYWLSDPLLDRQA